eukprot:TRINITY_DN1796_c0_g1_i1.p1 TRINITY_DN1796_c0_g1~~TRINITY_DN1796_c0_g1_i1.p1  ORF type:complete len:566 (+),score=159.84 TRINITY_DN1796_c0_g1_i1:57-1754(+)
MPKKNKSLKNPLGRSIIKKKWGGDKKKKLLPFEEYHSVSYSTSRELKAEALTSSIDTNDIESFFQLAEQANRDFQAKQRTGRVKLSKNAYELDRESHLQLNDDPFHVSYLPIPKPPVWDETFTREQVIEADKGAFYEWRNKLSEIHKQSFTHNFELSPFEKNVEVWHQLWAVLDRSQFIFQIVDCRNPLFYFSQDLHQYIISQSLESVHKGGFRGATFEDNKLEEQDDFLNDPVVEFIMEELESLGLLSNGKKIPVVLLNKSDLVPLEARKHWHRFFICKGILPIFFSAHLEYQKYQPSGNGTFTISDFDVYKQERQNGFEAGKHTFATDNLIINSTTDFETNIEEKPYFGQTVNRIQIELLFRAIKQRLNIDIFPVGFTGFPNVGKSSVINVLMKQKYVGVAAQPGKTKFFQSMILPASKITLFDCPGLVFPTLVKSKAYLCLQGVLSKDRLRGSYRVAIEMIVNLITKEQLSTVYNLELNYNPENAKIYGEFYKSSELLQKLAIDKGFMAHKGRPDESRAARIVLEDFFGGKLKFWNLPLQSALRESVDVTNDMQAQNALLDR